MTKASTLKERAAIYIPAILILTSIGIRSLLYYPKSRGYPWLTVLLDALLGTPRSLTLMQATAFRWSLLYSLLASLYLGAFCFALCIGTYIVAKSFAHESWMNRHLLRFTGIALLAGLIFGLSQRAPFNGTCSPGDLDMWSQLVCHTIGEDAGRLQFLELHLWLDTLGISTTAFLALVTCAVLGSQAGSEGQTGHLKEQMRYLRMVLYAGSIFLVIAILRLSAILHWSLAYLQIPPSATGREAEYYQSLEDLVSTVITALGGAYTFLLILIYVPAALLLNARSRSETVTLPISEQLLRLAAILGPLLAGPIGRVLSGLK